MQSLAPNTAASQVTPTPFTPTRPRLFHVLKVPLPLTAVSTEAVEVAIAAPPVDGEANVELVRFLAEVLDLKKSHIFLEKVFMKTHTLPNINPVPGDSDHKEGMCSFNQPLNTDCLFLCLCQTFAGFQIQGQAGPGGLVS